MRLPVALCLLLPVQVALAATPQQLIVESYASQAVAVQPGFAPSAERGAAFFRQRFAIDAKMPACVACHTAQPTAPGRHAVTGKTIAPLAVAANGERFSNPGKVEKWFGRNCREVVGRACSAGEKADFVAYMSEVR